MSKFRMADFADASSFMLSWRGGGWGDRHSWAVKRICFVYTGHNNSFAYCLLTDLLNWFQMLTNLENGLAEDGSMIQLNDTSFRGRPI